MINRTFKIPIYQATVTVILDKDLSYVEKKYKTVSLSNYGAVTMRNDNYFKKYVLAFEYSDGSIIAHEIVHLINYLYLDCGIELDRVNDEHTAYLTGWLFKKIDKILNEK